MSENKKINIEKNDLKNQFYKKWWFWLIITLVIITISITIYKYIENKQTEESMSNIGNSASNFVEGIYSSKSHLNEFTYNPETKEVEYKPSSLLTAEDVIKLLKAQNNNIGNYVTYTEETDLNNLLGRPNQYTSKVTFEDIRLEQKNKNLDSNYFSEEEINEPIGGTIEVFNNNQDMQKRKQYIEAISSSISLLAEYNYSYDYVLLRLNQGLTPSQVKEYEQNFYNLFN